MNKKNKKEDLTHERIKADFEALYNARKKAATSNLIFFSILTTIALFPFVLIMIENPDALIWFIGTDISIVIGVANVIFICGYFVKELFDINTERKIIESGDYCISEDAAVNSKGRDRHWLYLALLLSLPTLIFFFKVRKPCTIFFKTYGKYRVPIGPHYSSSEEYHTTDAGIIHYTDNSFYIITHGGTDILLAYNKSLFEYNEEE